MNTRLKASRQMLSRRSWHEMRPMVTDQRIDSGCASIDWIESCARSDWNPRAKVEI